MTFKGVRLDETSHWIGEAEIDDLLIRVALHGPVDFELRPCAAPDALADRPTATARMSAVTCGHDIESATPLRTTSVTAAQHRSRSARSVGRCAPDSRLEDLRTSQRFDAARNLFAGTC